jgi:U3 small nucleolar RNA-associated protein 6
MFEGMEDVIRNYPSPLSLRAKLLKHLYSEGRDMDGTAVVFLASRHLPPGVKGQALVDGLKAANEEILSRLGTNKADHAAYIRFVEKWCSLAIDSTLVGDRLLLNMN